jgi:hypothetical protein
MLRDKLSIYLKADSKKARKVDASKKEAKANAQAGK